jgi:hypothetical protein
MFDTLKLYYYEIRLINRGNLNIFWHFFLFLQINCVLVILACGTLFHWFFFFFFNIDELIIFLTRSHLLCYPQLTPWPTRVKLILKYFVQVIKVLTGMQHTTLVVSNIPGPRSKAHLGLGQLNDMVFWVPNKENTGISSVI